MTTENPLLAKVGEIAAKVDDFKKNVPTKAEFEEKISALTKDVENLAKTAAEHISRVGGQGDYSASATRKLAKRGVTTLSSTSDKVQFRESLALGSIYKTSGPGGHMIAEKRMDDDEIDLLDLSDTVKFLDAIADAKMGPIWHQQKSQLGEREAFLRQFPVTGKKWDAVVTDMRKTTGQIDTTTAGLGLEWIPTVWGTSMFDQVRLECPEINFFPHIFLPAASWKWPGKTSPISYLKKSEAGNAQLSNLGTTSVTYTTRLGACYTTYTDEVDEDSVLALVPILRADMIRGTREGMSRAIMSGSVAATHFDTDTAAGSSALPEKLCYGLRFYTLGSTDFTHSGGAAAASSSIMLAALAKMGKYAAGASLNEVGWFVSAKDWIRLLADSSLITVQNRGPSATILTGQVGSIASVPVLISHSVDARCSAGVTATGENGASSNTLGTSTLVNRGAWYIGDRRQNTLETWKNITTGVTHVVLTNRWDIQPIYQPSGYPTSFDPSTEPHTISIINTTK